MVGLSFTIFVGKEKVAFDRKAYMKKWNDAHKEYKRNKAKQYYHEEPEKFREKSREYRKNNKEKVSSSWKKYYSEHKEELSECRKEYYKKYRLLHQEEHRLESVEHRRKFPNECKARSIVNHSIRDGKIVRGLCEVCGANNAHAHHDDYNKPLEVRWLCPKHHMEWHSKNKPVRIGEINASN